ncbi:MAG: 2-oxoglutarate dehydrogenase E1 subunit family protein, partial [Plesiomonas shigelloides]
MENGVIQDWLDSSPLAGANQTYIEQLYEDYLTDPASVDENWRAIFDSLPVVSVAAEQPHSRVRDYFRKLAQEPARYRHTQADPEADVKQVRVLQLINAFRFRGHQQAT